MNPNLLTSGGGGFGGRSPPMGSKGEAQGEAPWSFFRALLRVSKFERK